MNEMTNPSPRIFIGSSRQELGSRAAQDVAEDLRHCIADHGAARIIFAAAPSQSDILAALCEQPGVDWTRVTAFHMDEYIGLPPAAPQRFGNWLSEAIFNRLPFGTVHIMRPDDGPEAAALDYARLLNAAPIDICILGIGVNGHLAFNDPPADLHDPATVKIVDLDATCRQQQVDDGLFPTLAEVPARAITITVPALLRADRLYCCVPGPMKRNAVRHALSDPIGPDCPATALRLHPHCALYLDRDSAPE